MCLMKSTLTLMTCQAGAWMNEEEKKVIKINVIENFLSLCFF